LTIIFISHIILSILFNHEVLYMNVRHIVLSGLFAALTAALSQIVINIPVSPVPITLQVFSVVLAGAILGSRLGAISQLVYVITGAVGLPVFAGFEAGIGVILGPKGGYIVGFPVLAFITGLLIERQRKPGLLSIFASMLAGMAVFYAIGTAWLGAVLKLNFIEAIIVGTAWFFPLDALKLVLASMLVRQMRRHLSGISLWIARHR
jgi:biotin transport system substrate-specific component